MNSKTLLMTALMAASMTLSVAAAPLTSAQVAGEGYLVSGQVIPSHQREIVKHAGLQVIHADGAVTLRLKETERVEKMEGAAKHVVITCQDEVRPFRVVRHILSWPDCGAVETWVEVSHGEKGSVKLLRADSFAAPVRARAKTVRVMSLTGEWGNEARISEAPVGHGQIVELASKAGTRSAWESNAAVLFALGLAVDGSRTAKLCLRGLDAARTYRVTEINRGARLHSTVDGKSFTGAELMKNGLTLTLDGKYDSASFTLSAR